MKKLIFVFSVLLFFVGCETPTTPFQEVELEFYTLVLSENSGKEAGYYTLRSDFEYHNLFGQFSNGFDFQNEMIVAVYKGSLPNGGSDYYIAKITERENDVLVEIEFNQCDACTRAITSPYHIVALDRNNKSFVFEEI